MTVVTKIMAEASLNKFIKNGWDMASTGGKAQAEAEAKAAIEALNESGYSIVKVEK